MDELESRSCPNGSSLTLAAQILPGHFVQLSGVLRGDQVAGASVTISGAAAGSVTTDQNGAYSLLTSSASLGAVKAEIAFPGENSVTASATIRESPAMILGICYGEGTMVTIAGILMDVDAAGATICLSGVVDQSVVTDSGGKFFLTTEASGLGELNAMTTDLWGQTASADVLTAPPVPVIDDFGAAHQAANLWNFTGHVTAAYPDGMLIRFGGLGGALDGRTATVRDDGTFSLSMSLPPDARGIVTVITTDAWGQDSEMAICSIG